MILKKKNLRECPIQFPTSVLISLDPPVISLHTHESAPRKLPVGQTGICIKISKGLYLQSKLRRDSAEYQDLFFKTSVHYKMRIVESAVSASLSPPSIFLCLLCLISWKQKLFGYLNTSFGRSVLYSTLLFIFYYSCYIHFPRIN